MSLLKKVYYKIVSVIYKQQFRPGFLGLFVNPFYFARRGLYKNIKSLSVKCNGKLLDVGCGSKPYKQLFNNDEYIGIDIDQSGHSHISEDIDYFYDGKTFPFESETMDSIVSFEVLEHVFNPEEFLSEIHRTLKKGGFFLLTVPFVWDEHEQPYDYARYSSFGLEYLLKENGFSIKESRKSVNHIGVIFQLFNAYLYKIIIGKKKSILKLILLNVFTSISNLIGLIFSFFLPKNNDLYLDNIILAQKN